MGEGSFRWEDYEIFGAVNGKRASAQETARCLPGELLKATIFCNFRNTSLFNAVLERRPRSFSPATQVFDSESTEAAGPKV